MLASKNSFHPALAVSNIKTHISITLEMENVHYATWAELFKIHCRSHRVIDHIIPPEKPKTPTTDDEKELWSTLDATVLQWIYATISSDLLHTIIEPDSTAMNAWDLLRDIFQDNEHSRAVTLEHEFSHTNMADFSNASAYCQRLKVLSDQLKNVGAPVSNSRLVLQLVSGLTEDYNNVGTLIQQSKPLPPFYQARSMLVLEEAGLTKKVGVTGGAAMVAHSLDDSSSSHGNFSENSSHNTFHNKQNYGGKNKTNKHQGGRKSGGGRNGGGKAGSGSFGSGQRGGTQPGQQRQWMSWNEDNSLGHGNICLGLSHPLHIPL